MLALHQTYLNTFRSTASINPRSLLSFALVQLTLSSKTRALYLPRFRALFLRTDMPTQDNPIDAEVEAVTVDAMTESLRETTLSHREGSLESGPTGDHATVPHIDVTHGQGMTRNIQIVRIGNTSEINSDENDLIEEEDENEADDNYVASYSDQGSDDDGIQDEAAGMITVHDSRDRPVQLDVSKIMTRFPSVAEAEVQDPTCSCCYVAYGRPPAEGEEAEHPVKTPCNHVFGNQCLRTWLPNNSCPTCRSQLFRVPTGSLSFFPEFVDDANLGPLVIRVDAEGYHWLHGERMNMGTMGGFDEERKHRLEYPQPGQRQIVLQWPKTIQKHRCD